MRINKQIIYTTEECSFSVYFIYYLRNLLLTRCGGIETSSLRSNTHDKQCLVVNGYVNEISGHSRWISIKIPQLSLLLPYFGIGIYRQVPPIPRSQKSRSALDSVDLNIAKSITFEISLARRSVVVKVAFYIYKLL